MVLGRCLAHKATLVVHGRWVLFSIATRSTYMQTHQFSQRMCPDAPCVLCCMRSNHLPQPQVDISTPDMHTLGATIHSVHMVCGSAVYLYHGTFSPNANHTDASASSGTVPVTVVAPTGQPPTRCSYPLDRATLPDFDTLLQATKARCLGCVRCLCTQAFMSVAGCCVHVVLDMVDGVTAHGCVSAVYIHPTTQRVFPGSPAPAPAPESQSHHNDLVILLPSILGAVLLTAAVLGLGSWWCMRRHRQARKDLEASLQVHQLIGCLSHSLSFVVRPHLLFVVPIRHMCCLLTRVLRCCDATSVGTPVRVGLPVPVQKETQQHGQRATSQHTCPMWLDVSLTMCPPTVQGGGGRQHRRPDAPDCGGSQWQGLCQGCLVARPQGAAGSGASWGHGCGAAVRHAVPDM